jgi:hypothetical protein
MPNHKHASQILYDFVAGVLTSYMGAVSKELTIDRGSETCYRGPVSDTRRRMTNIAALKEILVFLPYYRPMTYQQPSNETERFLQGQTGSKSLSHRAWR